MESKAVISVPILLELCKCFFKKFFNSFFIDVSFLGIKSTRLYSSVITLEVFELFVLCIIPYIFSYFLFGVFTKSFIFGTVNVDLKKSFTDPFYVIDSIRVFTNEEDYPIDEKSYFSVSYSYNQKEYFVKLNGTKSSIIFDKESIFMVNGNYIDQNAIDKITLFYNNVSKSKIKSFSLKFIDGVELKNELLPFIAELQNQGKNDKEVSEELLLYMNDVYGEFDAGYLYSWFDLVLNLKI